VKIIKHSGNIVDFSRNKLRDSLLKSGATHEVAENVLQTIETKIYEGISTKKIYKLAFALLKSVSGSHAARYNLRSGLQQLGPAGFFFEKFVARLFAEENYETRTNLILQGKCVSHEIDVMTKKDHIISMMECKFHMGSESNSDVKVPLYILSRFNDLRGMRHAVFSSKDAISGCRIVTNNRFTADAITFATCSGLELLSWDYPKNDNLRTKIDSNHLYPVTCLTTLSQVEKEKLLILNILLAKDLINNNEVLSKTGLSSNRIKNILKEVSQLCNYFYK